MEEKGEQQRLRGRFSSGLRSLTKKKRREKRVRPKNRAGSERRFQQGGEKSEVKTEKRGKA